MMIRAAAILALLLLPSATSAGDAASPNFDGWYVVTVHPSLHYAFYREDIEIKNGRLFYQSHMWKKEEGFTNEAELGAFAENNSELTPLYYNFHSNYRNSELTIDGNVKEGKALTVKIRKGGEDLAPIRRSVQKKTFFSVFFPVWLKRELRTARANHTMNFRTILEDSIDAGFNSVSGRARMVKDDDFAARTHTRKLTVDYHGMKSIWWVDQNGEAIRIEMPGQKTVIERTTKEKAQTFLNTESGP